ncbi:MAG: cellulase family glycosylhydrolase [Chloroflexi bacterium]|nr:cellulase family glycosylhydrolase [Chloroflexota bacterium]
MSRLVRAAVLLAATLLILSGLSQASPAQSSPGFVAARSDGLLTTPEGTPIFLVAANYEGYADRSWRMWEDDLFSATLIEKDFLKAKRAGINALRIFVQTPLVADVKAGKWSKLDTVMALARKHNIYLILTFYDYGDSNLQQVASVDRAIAQRYANEGIILAYDLKNEPHYQDLVTASYPQGTSAALQGDGLIKQYGERLTQQAAKAWRQTDDGRALVPARFDDRQAYIYANNYRYYRDFLADLGAWVTARNYEVSSLDYMDSPDAARWHGFTQALDQTLASWIGVQVNAIRGVDAKHLITVGYSDVILAKMAANRALDIQSVHRYPGRSAREVRLFFNMLQNLRTTFPGRPLILEEFGYSNAGMDPAVSAIYESAFLLYSWKQGMAGGAKWVLNDLSVGYNEQQMNFGLFKTDDGPKPIVHALQALSSYFQNRPARGDLAFDSDEATGIRYVYSAPDALFVAAKEYQDNRLRVSATGPTQVFLSWTDPKAMWISATSGTNLRLNPAAIVGDTSLRGRFTLEKMEGDKSVAHPFTMEAGNVAFTAQAGQTYILKLPRTYADAKIQIVWPQGNKPVSQADKANIGIYLFDRKTPRSVCGNLSATVKLWRALNNGMEEPVGTAQKVVRAIGGASIPAWEFNDVDVGAAKDPLNKYYFRLSVEGMGGYYSNTWSHGEDARTYFPRQDVPTGVSTAIPSGVDAKIEIVWPQGGAPVNQATRANVGAFLFEQGTTRSVSADWNPVVRLWRALNNEPEEFVATGQKEPKTAGSVTFPMWTFNNVDVSAATNTSNKYYLRVTVDGVPHRSNIWSHGVDARTYFPKQDAPQPATGCE